MTDFLPMSMSVLSLSFMPHNPIGSLSLSHTQLPVFHFLYSSQVCFTAIAHYNMSYTISDSIKPEDNITFQKLLLIKHSSFKFNKT